MSSQKESNGIETSNVELSDGESVELVDELKDKNDVCTKKRKNSSDVHPHFADIDGMYKGKMVKKKQCIHCKHSYVAGSSSTTTSLKRHLTDCLYYQRSIGNKKGVRRLYESVTMEIRSVKDIPISKMNPSSGDRRRRPLRSRTLDTLLHIFSLCYDDSSHVIQHSDKGIQIDVPLGCNDSIHNDSLFQEQTSMVEAQVVLDIQEDGLYNKHMESAEHDHNTLGEKKDLSPKLDPHSSVNFDIKSQDNYNMISSFPHLPTNGDVEEGEIFRDFMDDTKSVGHSDSVPQDYIGTKAGLKNNNNPIPLITKAVENGGRDAARVVNKTTRNLVDYSEIAAHAKSQESAKQPTLKINTAKNQSLVSPVKDSGARSNRKRQGSCTEEERRNKKSKKSVDPTTCPENLTLLGEHLEDASQKVVNASANKVACNEKKKKRVVTKERKAKKKMKERIKRAEKNRKLGVKRLKLQPVIKEKKITYCRHYMNGRCHEGEKCKFSHDTTPLTKSKPCCHFARHTCMKGDDCPYDHQLSKYPCNNYQTKGSCSRGSDCMFSHEAQPGEATLNESNKAKPEQKSPSNSSSKKLETISVPVPKFVDITQKSTRPPKGINFLSQGKLPLVSHLSPKVNYEVKEFIKTPPLIQDFVQKLNMPPVVQDSEKTTKMPGVVPRGINFLSFGKKPGLDSSSSAFKISNGVEKSRLSDAAVPLASHLSPKVKSDSTVNVVNKAIVNFSTDSLSSSKKPMPMMSFMSSTSQKALQSTLAFASALDSGLKSKV